jgi:3-hydroxyacyl-[acyl-carrier-protein] dehydratase
MLHGDFFHIVSFQNEEGIYVAELKINAEHPLFVGHFPGQPVVPGVCMIEIVRELLELSLQAKIRMQKAAYFKFLSVIDPRHDPAIKARLHYSINTDGDFDVESSFTKNETLCFKGRAVFRKENA